MVIKASILLSINRFSLGLMSSMLVENIEKYLVLPIFILYRICQNELNWSAMVSEDSYSLSPICMLVENIDKYLVLPIFILYSICPK